MYVVITDGVNCNYTHRYSSDKIRTYEKYIKIASIIIFANNNKLVYNYLLFFGILLELIGSSIIGFINFMDVKTADMFAVVNLQIITSGVVVNIVLGIHLN